MKLCNYPFLFSRLGLFLLRTELTLGQDQVVISKATFAQNLLKYLKDPLPESEMGIMSYSFPKREWDSKFVDYIKKIHKNGVKIKIVGGPKIKAKEALEKLLEEGIEIRILKKPISFHVVYTTNPRQLWVEEYHKNGYARNVHFTPLPYEDAWTDMKYLFGKVWEKGKPLKEVKFKRCPEE